MTFSRLARIVRARRLDWFVIAVSLAFAAGCGGIGGCGGCASFAPTPGGFPAAKRTPNATQVRVSSSGLAAIAADPATLLGSILGTASDGILRFNAPVNCGGGTPTCCPGGRAQNPCGPIDIDLKTPGAQPRLELRPSQGNAQLGITVRARVKTERDIPVNLPVLGDCGLAIDTSVGTIKEVQIDAPVNFVTDGMAGTTRANIGTVTIGNLATEDVRLTGGFFCQATNLILGLLIGVLRDNLTAAVQSTIQGQTCKACPSGQVAECGSSFATACTGGVCMQGAQCFQELGLAGRVNASALLGGISPGTRGAFDLYAVAGGATTNNNGLALALYGGMQPAGTARDRCGPPGRAPGRTTIALSPFFTGNTRPDTNQPFDIALGVHRSQLAELAYAGYDGGALCLTIGHSFAAQLSTETLGLLSRSLNSLVEATAPMAVGVRPQSPPEIALGKNTFMDDGAGGKRLVEPLLDVKFTAAELDFFLAVNDQWIRTFTVVADIRLPIGLQVAGMGQLIPVIGDTTNAFTNVSIKNSEAITEMPATLAAVFPSVLGLVLPQLSGAIGPITLPSIGGLSLDVKDVTAVDGNAFLAVFANLRVAAPLAPVETRAAIAAIDEPGRDTLADPARWAAARAPTATLELGGDRGELEWSVRIDDGTWSAWSASPRQTIRSRVLWLAGLHRVEVRARQIGVPETIDDTPVVLELPIGMGGMAGLAAAKREAAGAAGFHGQADAGCQCDGGGGAAPPLALLAALALMSRRRLRRWRDRLRRWTRGLARTGRVAWVAWLGALACLPGCSCDHAPATCGDNCKPGEVAHGSLGRYTSIAADGDRVLVATYDNLLGDLVVADATNPASPQLSVVDGIAIGAVPIYDGGYRGGIEAAGPNVGAWASIAMAGGRGRVAYQDRDAGALKYAQELGRNDWTSYVVDDGDGAAAGAYASIAIDSEGRPAIAYLALGADTNELRLARARTKDPGERDWSIAMIASAPAGETDPKVVELPNGTGLFASLVALPDGRLAIAYYDRDARALMLAVETGAATGAFTEVVLDATAGGDRGMWSSAAVDAAGKVHVAYQDALGDQLMYTTWNGAPGAIEVVDDGQRTGDRPHNVGAAAAMYLVNGAPAIAYQDGLASDVYVAMRGTTWSTTALATGPLLDGFSIAATTGHGAPVLAWGAFDPAAEPIGRLVVKAP